MINLRKIISSYMHSGTIMSENTNALLQYFTEKPLNFKNEIIRKIFSSFVGQSNIYENIFDISGEFIDLNEIEDNPDKATEIYNILDPETQMEFHDLYVNNPPVDPIMEPSYKFIDIVSELNSDTLLVRFVGSGQFNAVMSDGFKLGLSDLDKLHATEYYDRTIKENGGYIFAYEANSPEAKKQATTTKIGQSYGTNCIFFKHSGLSIYHKLDNEKQVITYGLDIDPKECIFAQGTDDGKFLITNRPFDKTPKTYNDMLKIIEKI